MAEDFNSDERFHEVCAAVRSWIRFCRGVAVGSHAGEPFDAIDVLADVGLLACRELRRLSGVADKRDCPEALKVAGRKRVRWPVDVTAGIGKNTGEGERLKAMAAAVELGADRAIDVEETEHLCHVAIPDADFVKDWLKACADSTFLGDLQGAEFLVAAGLEICAVLDELSMTHPAVIQQVARYRLLWPLSLTYRASRDAWRDEFSAIKKRLQGIGLGMDHYRTWKVGQKPGAGKLNPAVESKDEGRDTLNKWIEKYVSLVQAIREQAAALLKCSQLHGLPFEMQPMTVDVAAPGEKEFDPEPWWSNAIAMPSFNPAVKESIEAWTELVWRLIRFEFAADLADRKHPIRRILQKAEDSSKTSTARARKQRAAEALLRQAGKKRGGTEAEQWMAKQHHWPKAESLKAESERLMITASQSAIESRLRTEISIYLRIGKSQP